MSKNVDSRIVKLHSLNQEARKTLAKLTSDSEKLRPYFVFPTVTPSQMSGAIKEAFRFAEAIYRLTWSWTGKAGFSIKKPLSDLNCLYAMAFQEPWHSLKKALAEISALLQPQPHELLWKMDPELAASLKKDNTGFMLADDAETVVNKMFTISGRDRPDPFTIGNIVEPNAHGAAMGLAFSVGSWCGRYDLNLPSAKEICEAMAALTKDIKRDVGLASENEFRLLRARLEIEAVEAAKTSPVHTTAPEKECEGAAKSAEDETAYRPLKEFIDPEFPSVKAINKALKANDWIRWRRPKDKNGNEIRNRKNLHGGDWHKFKTQSAKKQSATTQAVDPLDLPAYIVDEALAASERQKEIRKRKEAWRK